ncbi:MAG: hypothetical protein ACT6Q9_02050 [Polaromonas sp.]|uniref:hypothetical protein n=1 Tax=Polaromonas sp. TaxID=1869339 RepID=UPI0040362D65
MYIRLSTKSPKVALNRVLWNTPACAIALLVLWLDGRSMHVVIQAVLIVVALCSFIVVALHIPLWLALRVRRPTQEQVVEASSEAQLAKRPAIAGATLVRKVDEDSGDAPLQTHRIYRMAEGSYFLFICTAGQPGYLTELSLKRAENALRSSPEIFRKEFGREA